MNAANVAKVENLHTFFSNPNTGGVRPQQWPQNLSRGNELFTAYVPRQRRPSSSGARHCFAALCPSLPVGSPLRALPYELVAIPLIARRARMKDGAQFLGGST